MEEIVTSLRIYKESKELQGLLRRLDSFSGTGENMAIRLLRLYQANLIDRSEYLAIRAKIVMGQYFKIIRKLSPNLKCGIYLYETQANRIWNASVANLPEAFNEYTQGLDVTIDVPPQFSEPVYTRRNLVIDNVEQSEHTVVINHKKHYLQSGINSFVTLPLRHNGLPIGHQFITSLRPIHFSSQDIMVYNGYSHLLESELTSINKFMIQQIRSVEKPPKHINIVNMRHN
jgi:uncharacterized protein YqgQ